MKSGAPRIRLGRSTAIFAVLAAAAALIALPASAQEASGTGEAVEEAVQAFHDALAAGDSARALELLHPDVRVFEAGHAETYEEYRSGHLAADMRFSAGTDRELLSEEVTVFAGGEKALYLSTYRMTGAVGDREVDAHGTETMVLASGGYGGSWRILHIHWSSR